jgi:hypothetical protein
MAMPDFASISRAALVWLVLSTICVFNGEALVSWMLPMIARIGEWLRPGFDWQVTLTNHNDSVMAVVRATSLKAIMAGPSSSLPAGVTIRAGSTVVHLLLPVVIWLSLVSSVKVQNVKERVGLTLLSLILSQLLAILLGAVLLAAKLDMLLEQVARQSNERRLETWLTDSMVFIETGGNVMFALFGVVVSVLALHLWRSRIQA